MEQIVYQKVHLELLELLLCLLSVKNRSILGHTFGVYGYEQLSADENWACRRCSPPIT